MSKNRQSFTDSSTRGRSDVDQQRDKDVYLSLLSLTDCGDNDGKPNESYIAEQWGLGENRMFVRRVLRSVRPDLYDLDKEDKVPGLTLGKLVNILVSLQEHWSKQQKNALPNKIPRILSRSDKIKVLREFSKPLLEEREKLGLPPHPGEVLLQQLSEIVLDPANSFNYENILHLYEKFVAHQPISLEQTEIEQASLDDLILDTIEFLLEENFQSSSEKWKRDRAKDLVNKVKREINRIEIQTALKQVELFFPNSPSNSIKTLKEKSLTPAFIKRLTNTVFYNEALTDEFPIFLKHIEIKKLQPLPLYVKKDKHLNGLLNPDLLEYGETEEAINGLERQFAYQVEVHFYIRLPSDYKPNLKATRVNLDLGDKRIDFFEEIKGVGNPISHVIAAINRVLLWDIPVLRDYFPVAHEVSNSFELIGGNNQRLVWAHTLVELCKREDLNEAVEKDKELHEVLRIRKPAYGEYCGFDAIEVTAKAALNARLRAIKQAGIDAQEYLKELCQRIDELNILRKSKEKLRFYPFSQLVMVWELEEYLLSHYRTKDKNGKFQSVVPGKPWSLVAYEAHLTIAQGYLKEGLYKAAQQYLNPINELYKSDRSAISNLMLAKLHLRLFEYYYFLDLKDEENPFPDRYKIVSQAVNHLLKAEHFLKERVKETCTLGEVTKNNCHPFYSLLSQLFLYRARLYVFYSDYMEKPGSNYRETSGRLWERLLKPVYLLEKARIYAAMDGDPVLYASHSAYQSWCYLMVAYLGNFDSNLSSGLSQDDCFSWARQLVDHALICYAKTGKRCYLDIKDNSGQFDFYRLNKDLFDLRLIFDSYYFAKKGIQKPPLIKEIKTEKNSSQSKEKENYDPDKHVLVIDTSPLKIQFPLKGVEKKSKDRVHLFGMEASMLLFALGMLDLSNKESEEDLDTFIEMIESAEKRFRYCQAIAEHGGIKRANDRKDKEELERVFDKEEGNEMLIRGLYPHRLTQLADMSKVFVAVCQLILLVIKPEKQAKKKIDTILNELLSNEVNEEQLPFGITSKQKYYNGHFREHYEKLEQYFREFQKNLEEGKLSFANVNFIEVRNKVVSDVFRIIRGESNVKP